MSAGLDTVRSGGSRPGRTLPEGMVEALATEWDVGGWRTWSRAPKGLANITLVVDADRGRFAVRCSNFRKTQVSLDFELALLEHLRSAGYPAPRIVPTRSGELYAIGADGSFCVMTEWITGCHFDPASPFHPAEAGRALGRFHQVVAGLTPERVPEPKLSLADAATRGPAALDAIAAVAVEVAEPATRAALADASGALVAAFSAIPARIPAELARSVIHGSYGGSALLFAGDRLAAVLDYDRSAWDWRALDLAYSVKSCAREGSDRSGGARLDPARSRAYLAAYLGEFPLPAGELESLPVVMAAQRLIKVAGKAANLVRKHQRIGQSGRDVDKLCGILAHEARMLDWLARHGGELLPPA